MGRLAGYANLTPNHVEMTDANFNAKYAGEQPGDWADISFDASSSASAGAELHRASCGSVRCLLLALVLVREIRSYTLSYLGRRLVTGSCVHLRDDPDGLSAV